jgi:hypothetical protein
VKSRVAVEKVAFLEKLPKFGDRKCPGDPRESFIEHPDAMHFRRKFCERVFQQLQALALTTRPMSEIAILRQLFATGSQRRYGWLLGSSSTATAFRSPAASRNTGRDGFAGSV